MIQLDLGDGTLLRIAPLLRTPEGTWTLPDPTAEIHDRVHRAGGGERLEARWRGGPHLRLSVSRSRRGWRLQCSAAGMRPDVVDGVGVRLRRDLGGSRILVDGYHSWDWAGIRDATAPGQGWWGAIWGDAATLRELPERWRQQGRGPELHGDVAVCLDEPPRRGALQLRWHGDGTLDALTCGEPVQAEERTGEATALLAGDLLACDPIAVHALARGDRRGAGLPPPRPGMRQPAARVAGWMSWNCLGPSVHASDVLNAAAAMLPPGGVALLDDGWMPWWGDWVERDDLGASLHNLARGIGERGGRLGIWVAPFLVDPRSATASRGDVPLLHATGGAPLLDTRPPSPQLVVDASHPAGREHLRQLGHRLGAAGVGVVKLDFLYAGALPGVRPQGWSGTRALRAGLRALITGLRSTAGANIHVLACGAPGAAVAGLVDSCRSGGDAVINIPTAHAPAPPGPTFLHGEAVRRAQERNLAARAWLWGTTLPPDVDAVTLARVGDTAAVDDATAAQWLLLAARSGGPLLLSDRPEVAPPQGEHTLLLRDLLAAPPVPARPYDPLGATPTPMDDDGFYCWPNDIPGEWEAPRRRAISASAPWSLGS